MNISLSPFTPENLVSRDRFGSFISVLRLNLVLIYYGIPPEFRGGAPLFFKTAKRHRVSSEFIRSCKCVPMAFTTESLPAQGK